MKTVLVASSKGGVGKTTLATHLAAYWATQGLNTVLVDADPQGSSTRWAERRADLPHAVLPIDGTRKAWAKRIPADSQRVVIDAPAGAQCGELEPYLERADAVVIPVPPSALDIEATVPFINALAKHPRVRRGELPLGLVGNKLKPWTNASRQAMDILREWGVPLVAEVRDSQSYVLLTGLGRSLFDYQSAQVRAHQDDWRPLLKWLERPRN
ncbi:ParA family protein [Luteimonas sp. e5]